LGHREINLPRIPGEKRGLEMKNREYLLVISDSRESAAAKSFPVQDFFRRRLYLIA
jgi:hypothetical protein